MRSFPSRTILSESHHLGHRPTHWEMTHQRGRRSLGHDESRSMHHSSTRSPTRAIKQWSLHWCQPIKPNKYHHCVLCSTKQFHIPLRHTERLIVPYFVAVGLDLVIQFWPMERGWKWCINTSWMTHKISPLDSPFLLPPFAMTLETACWRRHHRIKGARTWRILWSRGPPPTGIELWHEQTIVFYCVKLLRLGRILCICVIAIAQHRLFLK